jgi:hypothetical protein
VGGAPARSISQTGIPFINTRQCLSVRSLQIASVFTACKVEPWDRHLDTSFARRWHFVASNGAEI